MSVVGIDLGTTNTVIACARNGRVGVLLGEKNEKLLPSVVSFHPNGETLVGQPAKDRRAVDSKNTIYSVKRLLGRPWQSSELAKARLRFPFDLREGPSHSVLVHSRGRDYSLPEISGLVLRRARTIAEGALQTKVERAVITVPAHFNELQRAATKVSARIAGLEVLRILNEPTAAALAYGLGKGGKERIAVYDFGGGTFDCTLLDLSGNIFEVLATAGDTFLGGDDVDAAIADRMAEAFMMQYRCDLREDLQAMERLRIAAERLKIDLSTKPHAEVRLREIAYGSGGAHLELSFGMTQSELETLMSPVIDKTLAVCQDAFSLAGMNTSSFDKVVLVGGSTRIPAVKARVAQFFGRPVLDRIHPDEIVGIGAAIQAAALGETRRSQPVPPPPLPSRPPVPVDLDSDPDPTEIGHSFHDLADFITTAERPPVSGEAASTVRNPEETTALQAAMNTTQLVARTTARMTPPPPPTPPPLGPSDLPMPRRDARPLQTAGAISTRPHAQAPESGPTSRTKTLPPPPVSEAPVVSPVAARPIPPPPAAVMFPPPPTTKRLEDAPVEEPTIPRSSFKVLAAEEVTRSAVSPAPSRSDAPPRESRPPEPLPSRSSRPPRIAVPSIPPMPSVPPVLLDVTPRALVVETVGGFSDTVVPRNAKIPCERTRGFTTSSNQQTVVRVRVAQGESLRFDDDTFLGELELSGLRPAARGEVTIAVTFTVDSDGTLQVTAADTATQRQAFAALRLIGGTSNEEVARARDRVAAVQ